MLRKILFLIFVFVFEMSAFSQEYDVKRCLFNTPLDEMHPFFLNNNLYFSSNNKFKINKVYDTLHPHIKKSAFKIFAEDHETDSNVVIVYKGKFDISSFMFCDQTDVGYFTIKINKRNYFRSPKNSIYLSRFIDNEWTDIYPFEHNSNAYNLANPSFSPDGNTLYFDSDMKGGFGGMDIWFCTRIGDKWSKPINAGESINTSSNEVTPYLDEYKQLYFSSDKNKKSFGYDIYSYDFFDKKITRLPEPINSLKDDLGYVKTDKDFHGYFSSNRDHMKSDVYEFYRPIPSDPIEVESKKAKECFTFYDPKPFDDSLAFRYNWVFGDGELGEENNVQHCYKLPGIYNVSLIIENVAQPNFSDTVKTKVLNVDKSSRFYFVNDTVKGKKMFSIENTDLSSVVANIIWDFDSKYYFDHSSFYIDESNYGEHVLKAHLKVDTTDFLLVDTIVVMPDTDEIKQVNKVRILYGIENTIDEKGLEVLKYMFANNRKIGNCLLNLPSGYEADSLDSLTVKLASFGLSLSSKVNNSIRSPFIEISYD